MDENELKHKGLTQEQIVFVRELLANMGNSPYWNKIVIEQGNLTIKITREK